MLRVDRMAEAGRGSSAPGRSSSSGLTSTATGATRPRAGAVRARGGGSKAAWARAEAWKSMGRPWRGGARARPHSGHSAARGERRVWQLGQVRRVGSSIGNHYRTKGADREPPSPEPKRSDPLDRAKDPVTARRGHGTIGDSGLDGL